MTEIPKMGRPSKKGRSFWGPDVWSNIHIFAASYKPSAASSFKNYINSLPDLLPCATCGEHLKKNLEENPPDKYMRNNHDLFFWTYVLHDCVNIQCNNHIEAKNLKKKSPSFEDVKRYYFSGLGEECKVCQL
jgi:Erv1 / Alr family